MRYLGIATEIALQFIEVFSERGIDFTSILGLASGYVKETILCTLFHSTEKRGSLCFYPTA